MTQDVEKNHNYAIDIQESFNTTIERSKLTDALFDISENTIDNIFDNPLVKQLPIVKAIAGVIQTGVNINDRLFLKKILVFLCGIECVAKEDRQKIITEIDCSRKYQIKVGEKLLYILDACDDYTNAQNVAKLFVAMLKNKITYQQYMDAAQIITRIPQSDLQQFLDAYRLRYIDNSAVNLNYTGLIYSETSEVEVEVDLTKIEQGDWDDPPEHYEADANTTGGETILYPTPIGEIIFEIFGIGKEALKIQYENEIARRKNELRNKIDGDNK